MALVHEKHRPGLLAGPLDLEQRRDLAVHREDAVGRHHDVPRAGGPRLLQLLLQVLDAGVLEAVPGGLAEPHAVDDARVVELVRDDGVLRGQDRLEEAGVGVKARRVQDCGLGAVELGDPLLQRLVRGLRAADEAHGREAEPELVERLPGRRDEARVVGEAEVVVGAEVEDFAGGASLGGADGDLGTLGRGHDGLGLESAGGAHRREVGVEALAEGGDASGGRGRRGRGRKQSSRHRRHRRRLASQLGFSSNGDLATAADENNHRKRAHGEALGWIDEQGALERSRRKPPTESDDEGRSILV